MNVIISKQALKNASSCDFYITQEASLQKHSLDLYYTKDEIILILSLLEEFLEKLKYCDKKSTTGNLKHIVLNLPTVTEMFKRQYQKYENNKPEQEKKLIQIKTVCDLFLFYLSIITKTCSVDILLAETCKNNGWLETYRPLYQNGLIPMRVIEYLANFNVVARVKNINPRFLLPSKTKFLGPISKATFQKNLICLQKTERTTLKAIATQI